MRLLFIFCLVGILPFWAYGQSELRGKVVDAQSQVPLEFTSVAVYQMQDSSLVEGSITDAEGIFLIENVAAEGYFLKISFIGFQTLSSPAFELAKNQKRNFETIGLNPDQQQLEGVEVQGQKITSEFKLDKQSYSGENFEVAHGGGQLLIFSKIYRESVSTGKVKFLSEEQADLWLCSMESPFREIR